MPEIVEFVKCRAVSITPRVVGELIRYLPAWRLEFTQINQPLFPHLVRQLDLLADAVEDAAEGAYKHLPYIAFAEAVVALTYAHNKIGIIPDFIATFNNADRSSVARAVLIRNERVFSAYAESRGIDWSTITGDL